MPRRHQAVSVWRSSQSSTGELSSPTSSPPPRHRSLPSPALVDVPRRAAVSRTRGNDGLLHALLSVNNTINHCLEWDKFVRLTLTYPTPDSALTHLFPRSRAVVAYTVLVWSRLNAPVELSTRYTTPDTTIDIRQFHEFFLTSGDLDLWPLLLKIGIHLLMPWGTT